LIFQTINAFILNNLSLKYQICTLSNCKDIGIRKFEFVAKTQFLCTLSMNGEKGRKNNVLKSYVYKRIREIKRKPDTK